MIITFTELFKEKAKALPSDVKKVLKQKLILMAENPQHPSLRSKKIKGCSDLFEASVTMGIRLTWQYREGGIILRNIGEYDQTLARP